MTAVLSPSIDLDQVNQELDGQHPAQILAWALAQFPTGLVQTSAFNVDDLVITDLLYRQLQPAAPIPVLFLETLHHFPETLELVKKAESHYKLDLQVYQIRGVNDRTEFAQKFGESLWDTDVAKFHHLTKIEPLERGLLELGTTAWITGRRRDQAVTRAEMPYVELDKLGRYKINPLAAWTRKQSWIYVAEHGMMYNPLHDQGYASIGDEPLTTPVGEGEDERAGRWRGLGKTECGIHI
ncbi:phosphoadenosine phosphosulfate reductase [Thermosynechococcaceae cyanobacterium BACA0444]|uniref:Phosphoadenosine 5'-phosphosulfate reductase n=1 Tax=Pseudocalidococcus azoricus BACA0444 TaxID=2918990 RepID=A0AAE4FPB3_9CYAN|nr:phosphoadenosine phosphosulfate reductase [Pseudocalidococcus azoricus]MDS3859610.1 phosphoadenosine phosphosulfate reductase [Pseudocalidococcus azoricus BACA0444]